MLDRKAIVVAVARPILVRGFVRRVRGDDFVYSANPCTMATITIPPVSPTIMANQQSFQQPNSLKMQERLRQRPELSLGFGELVLAYLCVREPFVGPPR